MLFFGEVYIKQLQIGRFGDIFIVLFWEDGNVWKKFFRKVYEYFIVALASALNALSLHAFVNPNHMVPGGFSGISSIIYYFVPNGDMSLIYLLINIPLLLVSLIFLRGDYTFKTIWATVVCSAVLAILPPDLIFVRSKLIAVIFGGVMIGASMYVAVQYNGSNGGTEVIAKIVYKYRPEVDLSKVIFLANTAILICGSMLLIFVQHQEVWVVVYSFIYVFCGSEFMGMLQRGFDHPQKFIIITEHPDKMKKVILKRFHRGLTCMDVIDKYGKEGRTALVVVVQYRQASILKRIIRKYDPDSFTIVKDIYDVFSRPTFNRSYK